LCGKYARRCPYRWVGAAAGGLHGHQTSLLWLLNTDLETLLRCLQVDTVVVTGIITDGCVLMTAMDAHARDFYLRVVMDATATTGDEAHQAALRIMARTQPGVLVNSEEAIELLV
jgi:nicotinamidase-related amidase